MQRWQDVLAQVHGRHAEIVESGSIPYYRVQLRSEWQLLSSAHRCVNRLELELGKKSSYRTKVELLHRLERSAYRTFRDPGFLEFWPYQSSDWSWFFALEKHGFPTRLMNWTASFTQALKAARIGRDKSEPIAIFIVDPHDINERSIGTRSEVLLDSKTRGGEGQLRKWHPNYRNDSESLPPIAINPGAGTHSRYIACGDGFEPLEAQFEEILKIEIMLEVFGEVNMHIILTQTYGVGSGDQQESAREMVASERFLEQLTCRAKGGRDDP